VALGDAGSVGVAVTAEGIRVVDVEAARGWALRQHAPKGFRRRRRPSPYVALTLSRGAGPAGRQWELAIERHEDGGWRAAVLHAWAGPPDGVVETEGGRLRAAVVDGALAIAEAEPRTGHRAHTETHGGYEVVAVFHRDGVPVGDGEEWEVVIRLGDPPGAPAQLEVDHRWVYQPLLG
jgi:hypothetical protein